MIRSIVDLARHVDAYEETIASIDRRVYKDTACGAWVQEIDGGIEIGSIVEGTDECAETQQLLYPFSGEAFDAAVKLVEEDVDRIWNETHGCSQCGLGGPINPDCPLCKGEGTVL